MTSAWRGTADAARRRRQAVARSWISAAARSPDSIAPWIHACASDACSPAKCTRPSGAITCSCSSDCCPGSKRAKAPWILEGMGLADLEKSESALEELRAKGLAGD